MFHKIHAVDMAGQLGKKRTSYVDGVVTTILNMVNDAQYDQLDQQEW